VVFATHQVADRDLDLYLKRVWIGHCKGRRAWLCVLASDAGVPVVGAQLSERAVGIGARCHQASTKLGKNRARDTVVAAVVVVVAVAAAVVVVVAKLVEQDGG
jgi:hypothetical protein